MKKILTFILLFSLLGLTSCFDKDKEAEEETKIIKKTEKTVDEKRKLNIEPVIKVKSENDGKLSAIENEINKEADEKKKEYNQKLNSVKNNISEYFNAINEDKEIIKYIDEKSIIKIKRNTGIVFSALGKVEKENFLTELKEYGFNKKSFDPSNDEDIKQYIDFIVKAGFKKVGNIEKIEFSKFQEIDDLYSIKVKILYTNKKVKNNRMFLTNDMKIIISN